MLPAFSRITRAKPGRRELAKKQSGFVCFTNDRISEHGGLFLPEGWVRVVDLGCSLLGHRVPMTLSYMVLALATEKLPHWSLVLCNL